MENEKIIFGLTYALNKKTPSMHSIECAYGTIELDEELQVAVRAAIEPILESRLKAARLIHPATGNHQ